MYIYTHIYSWIFSFPGIHLYLNMTIWIQAIVLAFINGNQNLVETRRGINKRYPYCWEQLSRFPGVFLASGEARRGEGEEAGSFPVGEKRRLKDQTDIKQPPRVIWSRFAALALVDPWCVQQWSCGKSPTDLAISRYFPGINDSSRSCLMC